MINTKDKKILVNIHKNSRISYSKLMQNVGISRPSLLKRIKFLEENKVIWNYLLNFNYFKLGFRNVNIFFESSISDEALEHKIDLIAKIENVTWVATLLGKWNLGISIFYKTDCEFKEIFKEIFNMLGNSIINYSIFYIFENNFLFYDNFLPFSKPKNIKIINAGDTQISLNKKQEKLLFELVKEPRESISKLAFKLKTSGADIVYNINQLENKKIITAYSSLIDFNKLNYTSHIIFLNVKPSSDISKIKNFIIKTPGVLLVTETLDSRLIVDIVTENNTALANFISLLKREFNNQIISYDTQVILKLYKLNKKNN